MNSITVGKLFELYMDTLQKCGIQILNLSDEMIGYYIFEEFIVGITSFLSKNSLDRLENEGIIDEEIYSQSEMLRTVTLEIEQTDLWNIDSVKNSKKWKTVMQISDNIKELICQRWNKSEIEYFYSM